MKSYICLQDGSCSCDNNNKSCIFFVDFLFVTSTKRNQDINVDYLNTTTLIRKFNNLKEINSNWIPTVTE